MGGLVGCPNMPIVGAMLTEAEMEGASLPEGAALVSSDGVGGLVGTAEDTKFGVPVGTTAAIVGACVSWLGLTKGALEGSVV